MKKFAVAVSVVVLLAFAAPVLAATNPFMDVPMNHWAYDAIGQLAAHGILSGYPDGTYKGKQPTTRYEMASALARALAVVDMTKASKQDVEMLKRLVVEFKDELEALGVKVEDLDQRVKVLEDRLGGWHIYGVMRLDVRNFGDRDAPTPENDVSETRARLFFERYFGEDESMYFRARIDNTNSSTTWQQFYVTMPFFFDTRLWVGRFLAWEEMPQYYLGGNTAMPATGAYAALDDIVGDRQITGLGISKNFGMGSFNAYVAHPNAMSVTYDSNRDGELETYSSLGTWELYLKAALQFTEQFGFDIGGHAYIGDNAEVTRTADGVGYKFSNLWKIWAGLRFDFNDSIALKGIYYHQKTNGDYALLDTVNNRWNWFDADHDGSNHWRVIIDVKQDLLKFTSLWAEYGQMDGGFYIPTGVSGQGAMFATPVFSGTSNSFLADDLKYWRVSLGQQWTEKWGTHLFYFNYDFDRIEDLKEWGLGVQYKYNPNVQFGLNFVKADYDQSDDDHIVRFRTQVSF